MKRSQQALKATGFSSPTYLFLVQTNTYFRFVVLNAHPMLTVF